jgi:hypothetical protein
VQISRFPPVYDTADVVTVERLVLNFVSVVWTWATAMG